MQQKDIRASGALQVPYTPLGWKLASFGGVRNRLVIGPEGHLIADACPLLEGLAQADGNYLARAHVLAAAASLDFSLYRILKWFHEQPEFRQARDLMPQDVHSDALWALKAAVPGRRMP